MDYAPDKWLILKISGIDPHYKVFGVWAGGYLYGDSWRMNSGIVRSTDGDEFINFYGSSGSCYSCNKTMYGSTAYGINIVSAFIERAEGKLAAMSEDTDWLSMDWLIK